MNLFQVPSIIQSIRTLVDGGCKLDIVTRELSPSEMTELFSLKNKEGWLLFKENEVVSDDIKNLPDIKDEFDKKTPSQRQRNIIYKIWELTDRKKDFSDFYLSYMEKINNWLKEKLN